MLEARVPVVYDYIADAHERHTPGHPPTPLALAKPIMLHSSNPTMPHSESFSPACRSTALQVMAFGLCASVDFSEINQLSKKDIKDLRDMREHIVDYFKGEGWVPARWYLRPPMAAKRTPFLLSKL